MIKRQKLLILGAGGHGKAVAEAALLSGKWHDVAFVDDCWPQRSTVFGINVVSNIEGLPQIASDWTAAIPAIGNNALRQQWMRVISSVNMPIATVIHPSACVSSSAIIGNGLAIMALAMVGVDVKMGQGVIINAHSTVDHDVVLGDFVHLGVGTHLAGGVKVGDNSWLQVGSCAGYRVVLADNHICNPGTIFSAL